jgi:hypothetical protein
MSKRALVPLAIVVWSAVIGIDVWLGDSAAPAAATPVIRAAGDIAGAGVGDNQTAALLPGADHVLTLGDNAYPNGALADYTARYDPSWGAHKSRPRPIPGNHEWQTAGAAGYEAYFGEPDTHWYTWTLPGWRLIALNSTCAKVAGCGAGRPQHAPADGGRRACRPKRRGVRGPRAPAALERLLVAVPADGRLADLGFRQRQLLQLSARWRPRRRGCDRDGRTEARRALADAYSPPRPFPLPGYGSVSAPLVR